jgi:pyruvate carboxylase subunit B
VHYEIDINGRLRHVTVHRIDGRCLVTVDGKEASVDAVRLDAHTWSLLIGTSSIEVTMAPGLLPGQLAVGVGSVPVELTLNGRGRFGRAAQGASTAQSGGPDRVVAVMSGKVVRVLAKVGDLVRPRQALVVIEAMKMENELRAAREGIVKELLVREGQSVDAGTLLAVVAPA